MQPTYHSAVIVAVCAAGMAAFAIFAETNAAFVGGIILAPMLAAVAFIHALDIAFQRRDIRERLDDSTVTRLKRQDRR